MRSELLIKLTQAHCDDTSEQYKDVMISGPHDDLLMTLRQEELKSVPDMSSITAQRLNMDEKIFALAAKWLLKKGYIKGAIVKYNGNSEMPTGVDLEHVRLTARGIEYEKHLG